MALTDELPFPPVPAHDDPTAGTDPVDSIEERARKRSKWIPVLFLSVFSALLASFPARNSDLWMHLAAGRELAQGHYSPDAISDPSAGRPVHSTWLYNLLSYGLYSVFGDVGLASFKVLVVVAIALVLWRLSRTSSEWRLPTATTVLALLAMSARLLLQPVTISYLLLALALWETRRQAAKELLSQMEPRHLINSKLDDSHKAALSGGVCKMQDDFRHL